MSGMGVKVSQENVNTGFFPWHDTTKCKLSNLLFLNYVSPFKFVSNSWR
jgi:hypothetical protein